MGLLSYLLKELNEKYKKLLIDLEELSRSTFVEINQLKIMAEFSYRYGQQAADIENLKQLIRKKDVQ